MENKLTTYKFASFEDAKNVAELARRFGCADVSIKRIDDVTKVSFRRSWAVESEIIQQMPNQSAYRHGCSYTAQERQNLLEKYFRGQKPSDIALSLRREVSAVVTELEHAGEFIQLSNVEDIEILYPNEIAKGILVGYDAKTLIRAGVFKQEIQVESDDSSIEISKLDPSDRAHLYATLIQDNNWRIAASAAKAIDDSQRAFRVARQIGTNLFFCFSFIKDATGLEQAVLYQRELLRAHIADFCIEWVPQIVEEWAIGAKIRVRDWQYQSRLPPSSTSFPFSVKQLETFSPDLVALANSSNRQILERLTKTGNKMAACFLADFHRRRACTTLDEPHNIADFAVKIQDDFWPTGNDVRSLLSDHLDYDQQYAQWMKCAVNE